MPWMSKVSPQYGRARTGTHFITEAGVPLCSMLRRPSGGMLLAPFKTTFGPVDDFQRRCSYCTRSLPHHLAGRPLPTF